jgi:hypothetical protein
MGYIRPIFNNVEETAYVSNHSGPLCVILCIQIQAIVQHFNDHFLYKCIGVFTFVNNTLLILVKLD